MTVTSPRSETGRPAVGALSREPRKSSGGRTERLRDVRSCRSEREAFSSRPRRSGFCNADPVSAHLNVEIKARCHNPSEKLLRLAALGADHQGEDHQVDTYFVVADGRLKLRQGNIENSLIHYARTDHSGPKESHVTLYQAAEAGQLLAVLSAALDLLVVVDKKRQILWIDNVKFHVDKVSGLGSFVEIEAIDLTGSIGRAELLRQCRSYMQNLGIEDSELEARSYSDLLMPHAG